MLEGASIAFWLLLISFILRTRGETAITSFNFTSFASEPGEINFQGDAFFANGSLELNNDSTYSYGRALYAEPVHLWDKNTRNVASFTTRFSFSVIREPNATAYADGFAFFLVPVGYPLPRNTTGGELTLFSSYGVSRAVKAPVVAIEFDTFQNEWDPSSSHVGIDVGYIESLESLPWDPLYRSSNATADVEITYDNATTRLRASFSTATGNNRILARDIDLREELPEEVSIGLAGGTGQYFERHVIHSWSFDSILEVGDARENATNSGVVRGKSSAAVVGGALAGAGALFIAAGLAWFLVRRRRAAAGGHGGGNDAIDERELNEGKGPKGFSYAELAQATRNFSSDQKPGRGGFGDVYRGTLSDPKMEVGVKRVAKDSHQGKEYLAEVKVISRVRHRNLVKLVGWCHEKGELLLVYEYMPNGSLDAHLYGGAAMPLPWSTRYSIARGVASALAYLHEEWEQCVVHRDVKASNVMLDSDFSAKLGDFGLARLVEHGGGMETTAVAGTMGYLAPETATAGRASKESDVYSFGVLALEIACGRKPIEPRNGEGRVSLVEWVWDLYGKGAVLEAADERLAGYFDRQQMERLMVVGLWCAHPNYQQRPSMGQVIGILAFDTPLPDLPAQLPAPSFGGVSFTGIDPGSTGGWSSSASGYSAAFTGGSSVDSAKSTAGKPLSSPYV